MMTILMNIYVPARILSEVFVWNMEHSLVLLESSLFFIWALNHDQATDVQEKGSESVMYTYRIQVSKGPVIARW